MRERLVRLIESYKVQKSSFELGWEQFKREVNDGLADHLLANGVIVPPCKAGDTVYSLVETFCEDIDGVHTVCEYYDTGGEDLCALPFGRCPYKYRIVECVVTDFNLLLFSARVKGCEQE